MRRLESQFEGFQRQQGEFASQVNIEQHQTNIIIATVESMIRDREEAIRSMFEQVSAQRAAEMAALVADARTEFDKQRQQFESISGAVQVEFTKLQQQIDQVGTKDSGPKLGRGFLPLKELKPPKLSKEEQWRDLSEHFSEFVEAAVPGMK